MINEFQGEHRFLSNFPDAEVMLGGVKFPRVENAYQAAKCRDPEDRKKFLTISAGEAKRLGRTIPIRPDWEEQKLFFMEMLVSQKFHNIAEYREKLLATGDEELVEGNAWGDTFWGVCRGVGQNHLGKILMKIRKDLQDWVAFQKTLMSATLTVKADTMEHFQAMMDDLFKEIKRETRGVETHYVWKGCWLKYERKDGEK
jgi:ribA/ribD-fused uncharacterized protein